MCVQLKLDLKNLKMLFFVLRDTDLTNVEKVAAVFSEDTVGTC